MSLRSAFRPAFRAVHPALFLVALAIATAQAALSFGAAVLESVLLPRYAVILSPVSTVAVLALTLPLLVGLYAPVLDRTATMGETFRTAVDAVRRSYRRVFVADAASLAVAVGTGLAAVAVWFVLSTVVRLAMYVTGDPVAPLYVRSLTELSAAFAFGFAAGALVTRFADLFAMRRDVSPLTAWRTSLAFARGNPVSFLGYAALAAVLLGTSRVLGRGLAQVETYQTFLIGVAAVLGVGTVGSVLFAAVHAEFFRRSAGRGGATPAGADVSLRRVALAAVVLFAAVGGAGYVRTVDLGTGQTAADSLPDDPTAAYAVAANNTDRANYRRVVRSRNASDPDGEFRNHSRSGVDYDDRQAYVYLYGEDVVIVGYYDEGAIAMRGVGSSPSSRALAPLTRRSGNWSVIAAPGYGMTEPADRDGVPDPAADWRLVRENDSTLVYRVDDPDEIRTAVPETYRGMSGELANESAVTVTVDRQRGVVTGARYRLSSRVTGNDFVYRIDYEEVGTADLRRPREIGPPTAVERLWDALYY